MMNYYNLILSEREIKISEIDKDIDNLDKGKARPAIMKFAEDGFISDDWHFKFPKAFSSAFSITNGTGKNKLKKYQNLVFTLQKGDSFFNDKSAYSDWLTFCSNDKNRCIEIYFFSNECIRFILFKPTKELNGVYAEGMYRCNKKEFLQILRYGIDKYI